MNERESAGSVKSTIDSVCAMFAGLQRAINADETERP